MSTRVTPMLIFSVSYLFIFGILIGLMTTFAPNLIYGGKSYSQFEVPDYFEKWDIEKIAFFEEVNLTYPQGYTWIDFNPDINVKFTTQWTYQNPYIVLNVVLWELWFMHAVENLKFTSLDEISVVQETYIGGLEMVKAWNEDTNTSTFMADALETKVISVKVWFSDTNQTRNDIEQAYQDGKITMGLGFGMDDVETAYSVFNLVGLLLTFSRPEIFGASGTIALALNFIISAPVFVSIGYLVFYFVTSIIPFIRGA